MAGAAHPTFPHTTRLALDMGALGGAGALVRAETVTAGPRPVLEVGFGSQAPNVCGDVATDR